MRRQAIYPHSEKTSSPIHPRCLVPGLDGLIEFESLWLFCIEEFDRSFFEGMRSTCPLVQGCCTLFLQEKVDHALKLSSTARIAAGFAPPSTLIRTSQSRCSR